MRLHIVKHAAFEGPGAIAAWAGERGHSLQTAELGAGDPLPVPGDFDALVLMGGPMSVNDEDRHPWLGPEKALVRESLRAGKRILGVCLGSQMIASALGARVRSNPVKEIGFLPVGLAPGAGEHPCLRGFPPVFTPFHWHGETFDLPPGAQLLASSAACARQAFALGPRVLGLQFHIEVDSASLNDMVENGTDELVEGVATIQSRDAILAARAELDALGPLVRALLDAWAAA